MRHRVYTRQGFMHAKGPCTQFAWYLPTRTYILCAPRCCRGPTVSMRCEAAWRDGGAKPPALLSRFFSTERAETVHTVHDGVHHLNNSTGSPSWPALELTTVICRVGCSGTRSKETTGQGSIH